MTPIGKLQAEEVNELQNETSKIFVEEAKIVSKFNS